MILSNLGVHRTGVNRARSRLLESYFVFIVLTGEFLRITLECFQALCAAKVERLACTFEAMWRVFRCLHSAHGISELRSRVRQFYVAVVRMFMSHDDTSLSKSERQVAVDVPQIILALGANAAGQLLSCHMHICPPALIRALKHYIIVMGRRQSNADSNRRSPSPASLKTVVRSFYACYLLIGALRTSVCIDEQCDDDSRQCDCQSA